MDQLLQQVCSYQGWAMAPSAEGYQIEVPTERGRTQIVEVTGGTDPDGHQMAFIWSRICEVTQVGDPLYLLRLNTDFAYGALAIRDPYVIMLETQLVQSADAEEVMRAVYYVAKNADELEQQVGGGYDQH